MVKSMYAGFPAAEDISIICRINDSIHTHDSIFHSPYHIISAIQTRICHTNRCSRADRRIRRGNEMGEQTTDGALLDRTKDEFDPKRNESFNSMKKCPRACIDGSIIREKFEQRHWICILFDFTIDNKLFVSESGRRSSLQHAIN